MTVHDAVAVGAPPKCSLPPSSRVYERHVEVQDFKLVDSLQSIEGHAPVQEAIEPPARRAICPGLPRQYLLALVKAQIEPSITPQQAPPLAIPLRPFFAPRSTAKHPLHPAPNLPRRLIPPPIEKGLGAVEPVRAEAMFRIDECEAGECEGGEGAEG